MKLLRLLRELVGEPVERTTGWRSSDHKKLYSREPNIAGELPWMNFDAEAGVIELDTGTDCGALFDIVPVATDGLDENTIGVIQTAIHEAIKESVPEDPEHPWIVQYQVFDDPSLSEIYQQLVNAAADSSFSKHWLSILKEHFNQVVNEQGIFIDPATELPWRGKKRRVYACLYRSRGAYSSYQEASEDLADVAYRFETSIRQAGAQIRRATGNDLVHWLLPWLSPNPPDATSPYQVIEDMGRADEMNPSNLPFGYNLVDAVLHSKPQSTESGSWVFQGVEQIALPMHEMTRRPPAGFLTGERNLGDGPAALFDLLPTGTRVMTTIIVRAQNEIDAHFERITEVAVGNSHAARVAARQADAARAAMAEGERIFQMAMTVYLRESSPGAGDLDQRIKQVQAIFRPHGVRLLNREDDPASTHHFIQHLPFCYDYQLDRKYTKRARLFYARDIAAMTPLYGRSVGTGSPGLLYFNRGAEALSFDPITDREKAAHMGILGPTGAGKTAWVINALANMLTIHNPRIFIIDPKWPAPSFRLFSDFCAKTGLKVQRLTLTPNSNITIPPFFYATQLIDDQGNPIQESIEEDDFDADQSRDLLGEMTLLAQAMIVDQHQALPRAQRAKLQEAILRAAQACKSGKTKASHVLPADVENALRELASDGEHPELIQLADAMSFWSQGLAGQIFGREGQPMTDADITLVELGVLANEGYEDQMTLAFMAVMQHVQATVAKAHDRQTIVVADELHVLARNPFLGPFILKIVKVWRSLGCWFWAATQNVDDMDAGMQKLISNMEWFVALSMSKDEARKLSEFKDLSPEAISMLLSAKKAPGKYAEGVVISPRLTTLFRGVVPPAALALAQTEQHERAHRQDIAKARKVDEVDAAMIIAEEIAQARANPVSEGRKWQ